MKKSTLLILPISILCLVGCKGNDSKMPTINNQEFRSVTLVNQDGTKSPFIVTHFNKSPVGYISLGKYFDTVLEQSKLPYSTRYNGHKYILHNKLTNANCTIDFDKQTIEYDNYDKYNIYEETYVPYIDGMLLTGKQYFKIDKENTKYFEPEGGTNRVIDMSAYHIPLYFDQSYGYVPLDIIGSIIAPFTHLVLSYNGTNLYIGNLNNVRDAETRKKYVEEGNIFTKEYMEYTYNLLALGLDTNFGLDTRKFRSDGTTINYLVGGAYKLIEDYHDDLVSLNPGVSDAAYIKIFAEKLDDGGHTLYTAHNCLAYDNISHVYNAKEYNYILRINEELLGKKREEKKLSPSQIVKTQIHKDNDSLHSFEIIEQGNEDIAYLTFDKFIPSKNLYKLEDVNEGNYWENTMYTVSHANNRLRNQKPTENVKHLVIDLSMNTGGQTVAEQFIASWLCKGVTTKIRNTKDKTYQEMKVYADVNRDGIFDENDYLPDDINVYCMVSASSFSCGNLLPMQLKELRNNGTTKIMGDRSGGGSCVVAENIPTGLGVNYRVSSIYQLGTNASSSYEDFVTNENGIQADQNFYETGNNYEDSEIIKKFYDRQTIYNKILNR